MTGTIWAKFFWSDWDTDQGLKQCSLAAQGLWMRMLCICANGDPHGYLTIAGNPLDVRGVAQGVGIPETEAETLMAELDRWGVYSVDSRGRIFSRRMVKEAQRRAKLKKNGEKGGNPNLCNRKKKTGLVNQEDNQGDKPQKPEARSQEEEGAQAPPSSADDETVFHEGRIGPLTRRDCLALWRDLCPSKDEAQFFAMLRRKAQTVGPPMSAWNVREWLSASRRWATAQNEAMTGK